MTHQQLRPKQQQPVTAADTDDVELGYVRISTSAQFFNNTEGIELQLDIAGDAEILIEGLQPDGTIKGVSGTKSIDDRPALRELFLRIIEARKQGKRVILKVYSVSRLFRTKSRVPVETFIDLCKANDVRIKTKDMVYDFSIYGHDELFRMQYDFARRYNEQQIDLMHRANANKAFKGLYDGRFLCPGFIVDRDKESPTYNKYIPYGPHKQVVNRLLKRYREHGQFNHLASEVEKMPVVFPPFEDWVDKENIAKFKYVRVCAVHGPDRRTKIKDKDGKWHFKPIGCQFKGEDCKLLGYHISSQALEDLLISVELMGYWPVSGKNPDGTTWREVLTDEAGQPLVNHEAIVDDPTDWEYSFNRLSLTLLDGSPNPNRIDPRATWTAATVKQQDREPQTLLEGILTSPLGTVHLSHGMYYVSERRSPNTHQRTKTLTIDARWIEDEFRHRLLDRIDNTNYKQVLYDALARTEADNAKALISVDEQIARYEQSIANFQEGLEAYLKALGKKADSKTIEKYNQDITDERARLDALVAKKNAANAEEQDLRDLCTELWNFRNHGKRTNLNLRRFIKLITDSVSIDEYSSHFIRLTVVWSAPFAQIDVCYFYRETGGKLGWSEEDERDLTHLYPAADKLELLQRFYTKTWLCIRDHAKSKGIERNTHLNSSGITDRLLSLADWELMQRYGWKREKDAHWLIDVPTAECGHLSTTFELL